MVLTGCVSTSAKHTVLWQKILEVKDVLQVDTFTTLSLQLLTAVNSGGYHNMAGKLSTKPRQDFSWASIEEQCDLR